MENEIVTQEKSIAKLCEALAKAQAVMQAASKNKVNPYFKSKYADLDCIWDACRKPLTDNGLSIAQFATSAGCVVTVETLLLHSSGESLKSSLSLKAKDESPQSIGSAITYGRRYGLSAMVGISAEDDDDANGAQPVKSPVVVGMPAKKLPQDVLTSLANARKQLGDEDFFSVLGGQGCESIDMIPDIAIARQLLRDMKTVYEEKNGKE